MVPMLRFDAVSAQRGGKPGGRSSSMRSQTDLSTRRACTRGRFIGGTPNSSIWSG